jgi:hypothetical protein
VSARKKAAKKPEHEVKMELDSGLVARHIAGNDGAMVELVPRHASPIEVFVGSFGIGDWNGLQAAIHAVQCAGCDAYVREESSRTVLAVYAVRRTPV